jgi:hypothetical protein
MSLTKITYNLIKGSPNNVEAFGAVGGDATDDSTAIAAAATASTDNQLLFGAGEFIYNDPNISNVENISFSPLTTVKNSIYTGNMQQDAGKAWLQHNHLEVGNNGSNQAITSGDIPPAPLFTGQKQNHTNVLALWYQDFGLEATRAAGGTIGSLTWYYWSWLFHGSAGTGYEPQRHPWLGYYRGDDANVLDWQCYWMNEAGVSGVIIQPRGTYSTMMDTWTSASDVNHWIYQLFTNTPNFNSLTYALWAWSGSNVFGDAAAQAEVEASFDEILDAYTAYPNVSYVVHNNKRYAVIYVFETANWRGLYDNFVNSVNTKAMLVAQAAKFQAAGWGGIAIFGRNNSTQLVGAIDLESSGVLVYGAAYVDTYNAAYNGGITPSVTYEDRAKGVDVRPSASFAYKHSVACVATSRESHSAHPSTWTWTGSTPELFELMCRNALQRMDENGSPRILTIYNVSEWAEGGASLQPNMRDGKGYLDALRNALSGATSQSTGVPYSDPLGRLQTFTPVVADASTGGNVATPSTVFGYYYVVGKMCFVHMQVTNLVTTGMTSGNDVFIRGLPIAAAQLAGTQQQNGIVKTSSVTFSGVPVAQISDAETWVKIFDQQSGVTGAFLTCGALTSGQADLFITMAYMID